MFVYVLEYLKINKVEHENNPWTNPPQRNEKDELTTAAYLKVSTPVRSQRQQNYNTNENKKVMETTTGYATGNRFLGPILVPAMK